MRSLYFTLFAFMAPLLSTVAFSQSTCVDFRTFYANHGPGVSGTNLYSVELTDDEAQLTLIDNFNYEIHFAYGNENNILYLVNANGSFVEFYDVDLGTVVSTLALQSGLSQLYQAVYNPNDGLLYVGSDNQNKIFAIDLTDGSYTFVADAPIHGGDLVLKGDELYTFTRQNNQMRKVDGNSTVLVGSIPANVNGAALTEDGNFILANFSAGVFTIVDEDANVVGTRTATLDNAAFTLANGDMGGGCRAFDPGVEPLPCTDYRVYYININPQLTESTLYEVVIDATGTAADLIALETFGTSAHLGLGPDGLLYIVIGGGQLVIYDPITAIASSPLQITEVTGAPVSNVPHVVVDPADGTIYIASADTETIYSLDPMTGVATAVLQLDVDVRGGDLVITNDGTLWLVNRLDNTFYNISAGGAPAFSVPLNAINGAAILDDGTILVANTGSTVFNLINPATGMLMQGVIETEITFGNGDLAAGCVSREPVVEDCNNFVTYYYNYLTANDGELFKVDFNNGTATYTLLSNFAVGSNHIAIDEDGFIYSTRGSFIDIYDPSTQTYITQSIPLVNNATNGPINGTTAAVFDKAGVLWIAANGQSIYTVEFVGGQARATAQFGPAQGVTVSGGDLVTTEDEEGNETLWYANRSNNRLFNLTAGGFIMMPLTEVNGVSTTIDGKLLLSNGALNAQGGLYKWDPSNDDLSQFMNDGGPNTFFNGDLAARCLDKEDEPQDCVVTYYTNYPAIGAPNELFRVEFADGVATYTKLNFSTQDNHIALSTEGIIYSVRGNFVDIYNPITETYITTGIPIVSTSGASLSGFPAVVMDSENTLWIARNADNTVYTIEFIGGQAVATAQFVNVTPIDGGDLIVTIDEEGNDLLWHVNRINNTLYNFADGSLIDIDLPEVNGASVLDNGNLLFANGEQNANGGLYEYNISDGTLFKYTNNGGPAVFFNGDLAGQCVTELATNSSSPVTNFGGSFVETSPNSISVYPNPTSDLTRIVFTSEKEGRVLVDILDMNGRTVQGLFNANANAGQEYRVDFNAGQLAKGFYIARMVVGNDVVITKVLVQ